MGSQVLVAISSPEPSSFVTSGPSAAAPPVLVVKAPPLFGAAAKGLGSLVGRIAGSKPVQSGGKWLEDMSSSFSQGMAGQTAGGAGLGNIAERAAEEPERQLFQTYYDWSNIGESGQPHERAGGIAYGRAASGMPPEGKPVGGREVLREIQEDQEREKEVKDAAKEGAKAVLKPSALVGVGYMGYGALSNRAQKREQETTAEQERIQQIGEQARSKAGTGGGQVAVTA